MRKLPVFLTLMLIAAMLVTACAVPATPAATTATEAPASEAAAPAAPAAAASGTLIKVATQTPLSGPQSVLGTAIRNGAQLAMEQFGTGLSDLGFTVELAPYDDQASPDTGVANANQIIADPAVLCLDGHLNSGVMLQSMEVYHTGGLAAVSPANTNPLVTTTGYPEINRIVGRDDVQGVVGAEFAFNELGLSTVYIIHDQTAYGQGIAEFFRQKAEELGMTVLGFEGSEEQSNFTSIITPILAANPDLVYFGGIYSQGGLLLKQLRESGITADFMGPDGLDSSEMANLAGDFVKDMYFTTTAGPLSLFPKAEAFIADYETRFGEQVQPYAAEGFDAMMICLQGIQAAAEAAGGMPTRAQVAEAVRATADYDGITGIKTFNDIGDIEVAQYFVKKVISGAAADWGAAEVVQVLDIPAPASN